MKSGRRAPAWEAAGEPPQTYQLRSHCANMASAPDRQSAQMGRGRNTDTTATKTTHPTPTNTKSTMALSVNGSTCRTGTHLGFPGDSPARL